MRLALVLLALLVAGCAPAPQPAAPSASALRADEVIYEVYVRSFTPEGTFRAVIPRLDEIRDLGVTTIWLMPIHPVGEERRKGELGSPYAVRDYLAVNPRFGTEADFRALVEAAHARGLKVIIDLVANHTAWDNAWVEQHPEWYTRDSTGAITHPEGTDWTDVADLDYDAPGLRAEMRRAMRYWVEDVGIDGYRCDVAELVPLDFWAEAIAELRAIKPVLMLAEGADPALYGAGFDLTYAWNTYGAMKEVWRGRSARFLVENVREERADYPPGAGRLRFTTNHDETAWDDTPIALFGGIEGAQAAAVLAATLPGTPLIYNGQEVGSTQRLPLFEQMPIDWDEHPAMRAFYENLLTIRAASTALLQGEFAPVEHDAPDDVVAFERVAGDEQALVVVNVRDRAVTVTLPSAEPLTLEPYSWQIFVED